ncbi:unnamed protein product [Musa textilis]
MLPLKGSIYTGKLLLLMPTCFDLSGSISMLIYLLNPSGTGNCKNQRIRNVLVSNFIMTFWIKACSKILVVRAMTQGITSCSPAFLPVLKHAGRALWLYQEVFD